VLAILFFAPWADPERRAHRDAEALARVIRSEIGVGNEKQRLHVAWAVRNLAAERGESIHEMACSPCGPQQRGRPVSSKQPATHADRRLAHQVLAAPLSLDPTGGATHFINPKLQDELARSGKLPGYKGNFYRKVRRRWIRRYRWEPYYRLGPDLEMWGPRRGRR
jgi:hypothetical protein